MQNLTTDNRWGCTIRAVQMLIANSLLMGAGMWWSDTGMSSTNIHLKAKEDKIKEILSLFDNDIRG